MTLIVTVLTKRTIYQSADFRLTDRDTGKPLPESSTKLVTLQYGEWQGFIAYTGIGRWNRQDTAELVAQWLDGLLNATPERIAERICDKGTEWLSKLTSGRPPERHTFILAAFESTRAQVWIISNFQDCFGRNDINAARVLKISSRRATGKPRVLICGLKQAVSRLARRRLKHLVLNVPDDPERVRRVLAEINAEAARSPEAQRMISPDCSVVSFRADGQGRLDASGQVVVRSLTWGARTPDMREVLKFLGFKGQFGGMTMYSSNPRMPYVPCRPRTVTPAGAGGYVVREASHEEFASSVAHDVSDAGLVLGVGHPHGRLSDYVAWTAPLDGPVKACGFIGQPGGINVVGESAAWARMSDGFGHAVRWTEDAFIDLGSFRDNHTAATAINAAGLVVGRVCADSGQRGQSNWRPAAWASDGLHVLEDFGCDWGQAVDVNDAGTVLVLGYVGIMQCRAILWNPLAGMTELVGGMPGIYPLAITADGVVLGTSLGGDATRVACLAKPGRQWERLGTAPGFHATAMNDAGDVVGMAIREGYQRPWLRRASGEMVWLPYFDHHHCRPSAINRSGTIVGRANTDHGTHALIWTR
jgi:hypothetical protein